MPWPFTNTASKDPQDEQPAKPQSAPPQPPAAPPPSNLELPTWNSLTHPSTLLSTALLTTALLAAFRIHRLYLRRIPTVDHIPPSYYRKRSLFGTVTSVGDGDNFRLYHTPGGPLLGWPPVPLRRIPSATATIRDPKTQKLHKALTAQTLHIRLAGIDAPELAHFGRPAQPHAQEALDWLRAALLGRPARVRLHRRDQYDRAVATVLVRRWWAWPAGPLVRRDVGLEMVRLGLATVYEAKTGTEFGGREAAYREAERVAKEKGRGMWARRGLLGRVLGVGKEEALESPREYKNRMGAMEREQGHEPGRKREGT